MNTKERAFLRSIAMTTRPIFQIGKNGITDNQIQDIQNALEALELIKITVHNTVEKDIKQLSEEISNKTNSVLVQVVGNKITLYRKSEKLKKHILE